jgi:ATP-dependent Lhr-like helicase
MTTALDQFHPLVAGWFRDNLGPPTDVQQQSWPKIAAGEHLLITAPTGSGKTLTAFLWAINQFIDGKLDTGQTRVLYISLLKALNNDIQRNLTRPLQDLAQIFADADIPFPDIKVSTRSGDTDAGDRRRMLRHPPEILITTPESLNLLLSSKGGRGLLHGIDTLILDEIHAVVGSKRGATWPPQLNGWSLFPGNSSVWPTLSAPTDSTPTARTTLSIPSTRREK